MSILLKIGMVVCVLQLLLQISFALLLQQVSYSPVQCRIGNSNCTTNVFFTVQVSAANGNRSMYSNQSITLKGPVQTNRAIQFKFPDISISARVTSSYVVWKTTFVRTRYSRFEGFTAAPGCQLDPALQLNDWETDCRNSVNEPFEISQDDSSDSIGFRVCCVPSINAAPLPKREGYHCLRFNRTRPIDQYVIAQYEVHHLVQVNISAPWHQNGAQQLYFQYPRDSAYNQPEFNVVLYNNADANLRVRLRSMTASNKVLFLDRFFQCGAVPNSSCVASSIDSKLSGLFWADLSNPSFDMLNSLSAVQWQQRAQCDQSLQSDEIISTCDFCLQPEQAGTNTQSTFNNQLDQFAVFRSQDFASLLRSSGLASHQSNGNNQPLISDTIIPGLASTTFTDSYTRTSTSDSDEGIDFFPLDRLVSKLVSSSESLDLVFSVFDFPVTAV